MILEIPSLGRPFTLGMLYDCREEKLIPAITLWNREDLTKNICTMPKCHTSFEVLTSDTVSDKTSALNISGELKISWWSGAFNVAGSGAYLTDTTESKVQARVTLKYERTTKFAQLSMDHLCTKNITYHEAFDRGIATHVVTGILYGAQAFFVFDQKVTGSKQVAEIQGTLKNIALKIANITGNVEKKDTETEKVSQFSCTFYGDFALEKNPVTYAEAVQVYTSLPKLLGEDGENAVPLKVWLYPLKDLDDKAAHMVREISDHLVFMAESIMQNMSEVIMECNDTMKHPAAITFPTLYNKISQFKKLFEGFRVMFQKKMSKVLFSVRCGNMKESTLGDILFGKEKSPFRDQNIQEFLGRSHLEMEVVYSSLKQLTGFRVVSEKSELMKAILDPDFDTTICFNFSLTSEDLYLSHLKSWLQKQTWDRQDVFMGGKTKQWFETTGIKNQIRDLVAKFTALVGKPPDSKNTQFFVTSFACSASPGVTIQYYESGDLVTTKCLPPAKPMLELADYGRKTSVGVKPGPAPCHTPVSSASRRVSSAAASSPQRSLPASPAHRVRAHARLSTARAHF
ncbi:neoverrucotoxin subunit alpha-like [Ranitomeya imitator]|uniref:neoverrucotoxin subunit alpha-like n=1 Tax=Ranitomeya imitator TaxID=111125 RepID=UPI0037E913DE